MNHAVDASILGTRPARRRRSMIGTAAAAGLGIAVTAAGIWCWAAASGESPPPRTLGPNLPISRGAGDPRNITANNSPALARSPTVPGNLAMANRIDLPAYSCALSVSFDAGSTWADVAVPFPDGEELPARCYAPDVAFAADGTLHLSYVTLKGLGNIPNAVWVASSRDGGLTLSRPARATGPLAFQVRIAADPASPNRLYLTWLQAESVGLYLFPTTGNPLQIARSDDAGATWSAPDRVSAESRPRVVAPSLVVGPTGHLYVLHLDLGDDRLDYAGAHEGRGGEPYRGTWTLVLARSTDQGRTWRDTTIDAAVQPAQRFIVFLPPTPDLALDPVSGRLYAAFADGRDGDSDVWLWVSTDDGASFAPRHRINDTRPGDRTAQYLPKIAIAPDGRIDIIYYDRRADPANLMNEVSLQTSRDHGRTFTPRTRISDGSFDSRIGPGSERDLPDLGSKLALIAAPTRTLAAWTDTRNGSDLTSKQSIARSVIELPPPVKPHARLRLLGMALIASPPASALLARARRTKPIEPPPRHS